MSTQPKKTCCDDVLRARLESVGQAQSRSRIAFLTSSVVSLAIIIGLWNAYLSLNRGFLFRPNFADTTSTSTGEAQKALRDEWIRSLNVTIPILGLRLPAGADGTVVSALILFVICVWVFLNIRNENHTIGALLRETVKCDPPIRSMVFHRIVSLSEFTTVNKAEGPIEDLNHEVRTAPPVRLAGYTHRLFVVLPAVTILSLVVMDIISILFLQSLLSDSGRPLWRVMSASDWANLFVRELMCWMLLFPSLYLCVKTINYFNATEHVLRQYENLGGQECQPSS